jgi:hypothetical protein
MEIKNNKKLSLLLNQKFNNIRDKDCCILSCKIFALQFVY